MNWFLLFTSAVGWDNPVTRKPQLTKFPFTWFGLRLYFVLFYHIFKHIWIMYLQKVTLYFSMYLGELKFWKLHMLLTQINKVCSEKCSKFLSRWDNLKHFLLAAWSAKQGSDSNFYLNFLFLFKSLEKNLQCCQISFPQCLKKANFLYFHRIQFFWTMFFWTRNFALQISQCSCTSFWKSLLYSSYEDLWCSFLSLFFFQRKFKSEV